MNKLYEQYFKDKLSYAEFVFCMFCFKLGVTFVDLITNKDKENKENAE